MSKTEQLVDYGVKSIATGAFIIGYIQWVPGRIAAIFNSEIYIGYLISFQIALIVIIVFSIMYVLMHLNDLENEIENKIDNSFNYYLDDNEGLVEDEELDSNESEKEVDELMSDGGRKFKKEEDPELNSIDNSKKYRRRKDGLSRLKTSGQGLIAGGSWIARPRYTAQ